MPLWDGHLSGERRPMCGIGGMWRWLPGPPLPMLLRFCLLIFECGWLLLLTKRDSRGAGMSLP